MKVAILTVFYPEMVNNYKEYLSCISNQTYKDFTLVIVDDNFPKDTSKLIKKYNLKYHIISSNKHPQLNRIEGLKYCYDQNFDIVIFSDSDETMSHERVGKIFKFFCVNVGVDLVFNNSIAKSDESFFTLFYKEKIELVDILDFNMLGYGAMNCRRSHIPFIIKNINLNIYAFDWWLALIFLIENKNIYFLKDVKNYYRIHENNFVGPALSINEKRVLQSIQTKLVVYKEMLNYCERNGFHSKGFIFKKKYSDTKDLSSYILENGSEGYLKNVKHYFRNFKNIYWWQEALSLKQLKIRS